MGHWRLELLRLWRTRRLVVLAATFLILGLGVPILTYYLPDLVKNGSNGIKVIAPKQTPADAIRGFASNAAQLGSLVVAVVTASTVAVDAHPAIAAFYCSRIHKPTLLLLPRYLTITAAAVATFALGTLAAWYETEVLLGHVPATALAGGFALEALWFCFVTSLVALLTTITRSVPAAVGASIAVLLALSLLGNLASLATWLPTRLSGSAADLVRHHTTVMWHAVLVSSLASVTLVSLAVQRIGNPDIHAARAHPEA
jgi:ABC-2 type transport system permease protein